MKAKFIICLLGILLFGTSHSFSQEKNRGFNFERFKAERVAFITDAINLTPAEAEKFWPVYNEFDRKRLDLMKKRNELELSMKDENLKKMSDKEFIELSRKLASSPKKDGELSLEYNEKFLKILSPEKVVKLYIAEGNFREYWLRNNFRNNHRENEDKK